METFDQIWETSRTNFWSWAYPVVLWSGVGALIVVSLIRHRWLRRSAKLILILGFSAVATVYSGREIQEKWKIRGEWAEAHPDQMTTDGWDALTADGANLTIGPVVYGFQTFSLFVVACAVLTVVRLLLVRFRSVKTEQNGDTDTRCSTSPIASNNRYHPPNT